MVANGVGPAPSGRAVKTYELASLSPADAFRLNGKRAVFRIGLDSTEAEWEGFTLYDCQSVDAVSRSVYFCPWQDVADEMTVEATLWVIRHPATVGDQGTPFPAFVEYRLTKAVIRR